MSEYNFINVPVPAERVEEVFALLAKPRPAGQGASPPTGSPPPVVEGELPWDAENVRRFYKESSPNMQTFLKLLAEKAPGTVSSIEAGKDLPKGAQSVAGMLGAAGRRALNRHGRGLPWRAWGQDTANHQGSETIFEMSQEVAAAIKSVL